MLFLILISAVFADYLEDIVDPANYKKFKIPYTGKMYSGYLPVNDLGTKQLHYFFYPGVNLAHQAYGAALPVVLWLNGGPGCSSLYGALNENGPFVFEQGTDRLIMNEYGWNNFAHMIYLESPAGVGFSFGDNTSSDADSAKDNLRAVIMWFKKFPEYRSVDFYIAGESYAGTYIPLLANEILDYNAGLVDQTQKINLKGLMIGNGCTDPSECTIEAKRFPIHKFNFMIRHNLISPKIAEEIRIKHADCMYNSSTECQDLYQRILLDLHGDGQFYFNIYNVYGKCYLNPISVHNETIQRYSWKFDPIEELVPGKVADCDDALGTYKLLRDPEFLKAIHIDTIVSQKWEQCSNIKYTKDPRATYYLYPKLIKAGLKILKFSGDIDGQVPITGSLYWINKLQIEYNLPTIEAWRPWFILGKDGTFQNAGNVLKIEGLTFASIRNAGHMVPMDQPEAASVLASYFIFGVPLPDIE